MPMYLTRFSYTSEAWAKMTKNPEDRSKAARAYIESMGGKLHGFWYAFGTHDGYTLWEAPDNVSMAAVVLAISAGGALRSCETTVLLSVEETIEALIAHLQRADLIISFNTRDFDYQVLQPYTDVPLPSLPTYAMLDEIQRVLGYRLSFKHLLQETLGVERPDDRLDTVAWYRHAQSEAMIAACRRDIDWMRDLIRHLSHTGSLRYRDRTGVQHEILLTSTLPFAERYG